MIVAQLKSRLGNQMFQYAAARALAERRGTDVVLDTSWMVYYRRGGGTARYWLDCFDLDARVCPVWEVARLRNPRRLVYALQRLRPRRRQFVREIFEASTMAFEPTVLTAPNYTYLLGYFQFEDYFADNEAVIREAFTFGAAGAETERVAEQIRETPCAVSIHVRRGDYTGWDMMGFLDNAYFERGIETIARTVGDLHCFVFSDDAAWCRDNLRLPHPTTVVDRPLPDERAWEDMYLMTLCRHYVISNSTFSWWGAWLNPSETKLVVAPRRWDLDPKREGDPIPARWIRV